MRGRTTGRRAARREVAGPHQHLSDRVREAFHEEVDRTHQSLLNAAVAFTVTFVLLRGITYGIRYDVLPWGNLVASGVHIHHYVWGVALLLVVGFVSLIVDSPRHNPLLGVLFGVATALVLDEFALLLNLRDVYWTQEGRISVDIALGTIALAAIYFAARAFWKRLGHLVVAWLRERLRGGRNHRMREPSDGGTVRASDRTGGSSHGC